MKDMYVYSGGKKLRCGYTTGTCAAAASKAAAYMLMSGKQADNVSIVTPSGVKLSLDIEDIRRTKDSVSCAVKKDSGDDPDITNGIYIYAHVSETDMGIEVTGGEGVGIVTKPGLDRSVGEYAINSVPKKMIEEAVRETAKAFGYSRGFRIVISVPEGREIAKKTFNPRMGIEGGISIIGTTGIVEPMSTSALVDTIRTEANMRRCDGEDILVLTPGNYGERFISEHYPFLADKTVMCSNYIGDALDIGVSLGFKKILIIGHIGKLVKLGSGIMNTHSSYADGRMETLITCGVMAGAGNVILKQLDTCVTTDAALDILMGSGFEEKIFSVLTQRIEKYILARVKNEVQTGAVIFSFKNELILKTRMGEKILTDLMGGK